MEGPKEGSKEDPKEKHIETQKEKPKEIPNEEPTEGPKEGSRKDFKENKDEECEMFQTGEKPYLCNYYDKKFAQAIHAKVHESSHIQVKNHILVTIVTKNLLILTVSRNMKGPIQVKNYIFVAIV